MKSIFAKYLTAFTVILFLCISTILLVVTSKASHESYDLHQDKMRASAGSITLFVEDYLDDNGYDAIYSSFGPGGSLQRIVDDNARVTKCDIFIFDKEGLLVASSDREYREGEVSLNETAMRRIITTADSYSISNIEGFFPDNRMNTYQTSHKGKEAFVVLVSMEDHLISVFSRDIIVASITVALCVFLAALITIYVISRRTTQPLSEIVTAAKSYAKGRFDYKIEVVGNDEVAELASAINDMSVSLKHLDELRNSFLGNVSHDLRTPMTTIAGFVEGILDGTIPPEKHEKYLNIISQEVRRLSRLVNTLLEVSRFESGADLKPTDFNLSETARTVLISLESKISKKNIDIEFDTGDEDIFVNADSDSIHRVIFNLLDNAVKFTPERGKISINISYVFDGRKKRKAQLSVYNSGDGIAKEELSHIFDRFYKSDSSRGLDKSGTGLGLYIAKTTLLNHGEDISVDSVSGEYTEFKFTLPLAYDDNSPRR